MSRKDKDSLQYKKNEFILNEIGLKQRDFGIKSTLNGH